MNQVERILGDQGFIVCHKTVEPEKESNFIPYDDLNLCEASLRYLKEADISLWSHQHESVRLVKTGKNVCVTTSTSSGKTQIFHLAAMEILKKYPGSKAIAIYPMKALSSQQVQRWSKKTGLSVGKIDGDDTDMTRRLKQLEKDVLVITPDTLHAFMLGKLNDRRCGKAIKDFISNISVVIIDELHLYKGYFGTNAAYMFRRLNNVRRLLRRTNDFPQYITASATLPNAPLHSFNITGARDFVEVGMDQDGSPSRPKNFLFVERTDQDISRNEQLKNLVYALAELDKTKSITFVESRQKTGHVAYDSDKRAEEDAKSEKLGVFPYRSGYEERARETIQNKLEQGVFKGVISTSALEIGIDIDGLNVVIIADMPYDKNSYQQRIGRCGRYGCEGDSYVIIVRDDNSFASNLLFTEYQYDINKALPDYEPALYLEDEDIQQVHALCHVGDTDECEYKDWKGTIGANRIFDDGGCFPESFVKLCNDILSKNAPKSYDYLEQKSSSPHYENSLRFFGSQYQLYDLDNDNQKVDRPISRKQLASEAYRGAVRNTVGYDGRIVRHRVKVLDLKPNVNSVFVRRERNPYVQTSSYSRKLLIPNFKNGINFSMSCGETGIFNLRVYEYINIWGYYEINGGTREYRKYEDVLQLPVFTTTGTLFFHPSFNEKDVNMSQIAQILYEALLRRSAFDRNDLNHIGGRLFVGNSEYPANSKFVALYDASSLDLSKSIAESDKLKDLFGFLSVNHIDLIAEAVCGKDAVNKQTRAALYRFCNDIANNDIKICDELRIAERAFKEGTLVRYIQNSEGLTEDENSTLEYNAIYLGEGRMPNTANLLVNGKPLFQVDLNDIYPIENVTEFDYL